MKNQVNILEIVQSQTVGDLVRTVIAHTETALEVIQGKELGGRNAEDVRVWKDNRKIADIAEAMIELAVGEDRAEMLLDLAWDLHDK